MAKREPQAADGVGVRAVARFRHDGRQVNVGELLRMSVAEAAELYAVGMVVGHGDAEGPASPAEAGGRDQYARRDMRAKG